MTDEHDMAREPLQVLVDMAVDFWRLARLFDRALGRLDAGDAPRYASQLRYCVNRLEERLGEAALRRVNLEGQRYEPGIAASALNIGEFGPDDDLVIEQMLEPIVMGPEGVVRAGTVMLQRAAP